MYVHPLDVHSDVRPQKGRADLYNMDLLIHVCVCVCVDVRVRVQQTSVPQMMRFCEDGSAFCTLAPGWVGSDAALRADERSRELAQQSEDLAR